MIPIITPEEHKGPADDHCPLCGEKGRWKSKLTEADVIEIRRRLAAGEPQRVIAAAFGISRMTVSGIKTDRIWSHLKTNQ